MYIKKINLHNFRNYIEQQIDFDKDINIIYGDNAQGKTNIIEAIYLCSYGKSFRVKNEKNMILFGEEKADIEITYEKENRDNKIRLLLDENKNFFVNDIKQEKISSIVGKINTVIFTPNNINIIEGDPKTRRRFLDMMICGLKPTYLSLLNEYNKILIQRNAYLKQIKFENKKEDMLDIWDDQLAEKSEKIYNYRNNYINKIKEKIECLHNIITKNNDIIDIEYIHTAETKEDYLKNFKKSRKSEIEKGFTVEGIHRDDLNIKINNKSIQLYGSQGQKRTAILTLKLCELNIIKEELNETPILLLDDYMSELDSKRRKNFLENIKGCQVILTTTENISLKTENTKFYVSKGSCKKL